MFGNNSHFCDILDRTDNNQTFSNDIRTDLNPLYVNDGNTEVAFGGCATVLLRYHSWFQRAGYQIFNTWMCHFLTTRFRSVLRGFIIQVIENAMSGYFWNQLWHVRHSHIYVKKKRKKTLQKPVMVSKNRCLREVSSLSCRDIGTHRETLNISRHRCKAAKARTLW